MVHSVDAYPARLPVHEAEHMAVEVDAEGQGGTKIDAEGHLPISQIAAMVDNAKDQEGTKIDAKGRLPRRKSAASIL